MPAMKTVEINISIPVTRKHSALMILDLVKETLEDRFSEMDDIGNDGDETVADTHGFGGNTITLTTGGHTSEICL
jgi:hypothetical protein